MWSSSYVSMTQLSITLVGSCYVQPSQKIFSSCMNHLEEWVNKTMKPPSRKKWWLHIPNQVKLFEIRTWFNPKKKTGTFGCYASISMFRPVLWVANFTLPKWPFGRHLSLRCLSIFLASWDLGPKPWRFWWTYHGAAITDQQNADDSEMVQMTWRDDIFCESHIENDNYDILW